MEYQLQSGLTVFAVWISPLRSVTPTPDNATSTTPSGWNEVKVVTGIGPVNAA